MFIALFLALVGIQSTPAVLADDTRLSKVISMREEIASMAEVGHEIEHLTGVPIAVRPRIAERKVMISFKGRPASEAMAKLATCFFCSWSKTGAGGYELDLTAQAGKAEALTKSLERQLSLRALAYATSEILRLWNMDPKERNAEGERLQNKLNSSNLDAHAKRVLEDEVNSILHSSGLIDFLGAALSKVQLDENSVPIGNRWFVSANPNDGVGVLDAESIKSGKYGATTYSDIVGIVIYEEQSQELNTKLRFVDKRDDSGGGTSAGSWPLNVSTAGVKGSLDELMEAWKQDLSPDTSTKRIAPPNSQGQSSKFCSNMVGRPEYLIDFADRSGIPVVADAYRIAHTPTASLPGSDVREWLKNYQEACKMPWPINGKLDFVREDGGWMMFRSDHWWRLDDREVPESVLRPLELKSGSERLPLTLAEYGELAMKLTPDQLYGLRFPQEVLMRVPIGSLTSNADALAIYALCSEDERARALTDAGLDLSACSQEIQSRGMKCVFEACLNSGDLAVIRSAIRGTLNLKGYRFCVDERSKPPLDIRSHDVMISYDPGSHGRTVSQFFNSAAGLP